jgi:fatty acid desaturase
MDLLDWGRLSPSHWLADATDPISHPAYLVLAAILTLGLVGGIYLKLTAETMFGGHRFKQRQIARLATLIVALTAAGLTILLFRWQPVPLLSKRLWFYLWWVAVVAAVVYVAYHYRRLYPDRLALYEDSERRRRYLPRPGAAIRTRRRSRRRR